MTQSSNPYSVRSWFLWVAIPVTIFMAPIIWITHSAHNGDTAMNKDTSGPAFPHHFTPDSVGDCTGMSLRDWFAATASEDDVLTMLAHVKKEQVVRELPGGRREFALQAPSNSRQIARYLHADAMLEARCK